MISKSIIKLFLFSFTFLTTVNAQTSTENAEMVYPVYNGKMVNGKETTKINYIRDNNPMDKRTKYTITSDGKEIYEVNFTTYFNETEDSLEIVIIDKQKWEIEKPVRIKFNKIDSKVIICDYKLNMDPINIDGLYKILFSIDEPPEQCITLYQFLPLLNPGLSFILKQLNDSVLRVHQGAVVEYRHNKQKQDERDTQIAIVQRAMFDYKNKVIDEIEKKKNDTMMAKGIAKANVKKAGTNYKNAFEAKMETLFINYFNNLCNYSNEEFEIECTFLCTGNGKIIIKPEDIEFKSGGRINWVYDSLNSYIKKEIEGMSFENPIGTIDKPNFKNDLMRQFKAEREKEDYLRAFDDFIRQLGNDFDNKYPGEIRVPIPTVYSYSFKYKSETKNLSWKYKDKSNGLHNIIDQSQDSEKIAITPELTQKFLDLKLDPTRKKYDIQVCTITIKNGEPIQFIRENPTPKIKSP